MIRCSTTNHMMGKNVVFQMILMIDLVISDTGVTYALEKCDKGKQFNGRKVLFDKDFGVCPKLQ